jgi:hypothetical protein
MSREYCIFYKNVSHFIKLVTLKLEIIRCNWDFIILKTVRNGKNVKIFVTSNVEVLSKIENEFFEVVRNSKSRSQLPCGLRHQPSSPSRTLGS